MTRLQLPYGRKKLELLIPDQRLAGILVSQAEQYQAAKSERELVGHALANPIASRRLCELVKGKEKVVVVSSDHTRPVPSALTMPLILQEIRMGNPQAAITILVATGFHRASTAEELRDKYGTEIVANEEIVIHDCREQSSLLKIGTLPSGGELIINKLAMEADLLIAEGFIEPHFFAGFSGGRKSILTGIVSAKTVLANHCAEFIAHNRARTGILPGNPIHEDMIDAAAKAELAFILNVVLDAEKKVINAFAGHRDKAHEQGCQFVSALAGVERRPADIVITTNGGYPLDQNIYQAVKGMTAAESTCKQGGVIIIAAECSDGHGGEAFYQTFKQAATVQEVMDDILARGRNDTLPDQWESQILARILLKFEVIMVTAAPRRMVEDMHMKWAANMEEALELAEEIVGKEATITVIPDGVSVIVK